MKTPCINIELKNRYTKKTVHQSTDIQTIHKAPLPKIYNVDAFNSIISIYFCPVVYCVFLCIFASL